MPETVFPYPGGKSRFASWILEYVPAHTCFVEVFGGAAGVLVNKDPDRSDVEVYNDRDGDLVQFFEVLRERPEELVEWLETVPYSREVHDEWAEQFYHGYRPNDPIERAGQFFTLRYTQFGAKYENTAGFGTSKVTSEAQAFANKKALLERFGERFAKVTIENLDWETALAKYDGEATVFYCDPPYASPDQRYLVEDIDHAELGATLTDLEGEWLLSCQDVPEVLAEYPAVGREEKRMMAAGKHGSAKDAEEWLVMSDGCQPAVAAD
jgi:DNA adenine methylase